MNWLRGIGRHVHEQHASADDRALSRAHVVLDVLAGDAEHSRLSLVRCVGPRAALDARGTAREETLERALASPAFPRWLRTDSDHDRLCVQRVRGEFARA